MQVRAGVLNPGMFNLYASGSNDNDYSAIEPVGLVNTADTPKLLLLRCTDSSFLSVCDYRRWANM